MITSMCMMYILGISIHYPTPPAKGTEVTSIRARHLTLIMGENLAGEAIKLRL